MRTIARAGSAWISIARLYLIVACRFGRWRISLWLRQWHIIRSATIDMKQTLLFIRHGESTWNIEGLLPGQRPGIPLTEKGRKQATALGDALSAIPISAIISSPLERARETAEIIARERDLTLQFDPALMDTDVGRWTGQKHDELGKTDPEWKAYVQDPTVAPEGVETFPQVQQRALAAVECWRKEENAGKYVAFVAHADVIKVLIAHYSGLDVANAGKLLLENASVSVIFIDTGAITQARVIAIGWTPHPGWLKPVIEEHDKGSDHPTIPNGEQKT